MGGGPPPAPDVVAALPPVDLVVAADGGADHARRLGLSVDTLVGDLDSLSAAGLSWAREHGVELIEHPVDKDSTDLELAMAYAAERAHEVVVVDSGAGRIDHSAANLLLYASARFAHVSVTVLLQHGLVSVIRGCRDLRGDPGDLVSLLAVAGPARGVTTHGLRWPLTDAVLDVGSSWGVSNEFLSTQATVSVTDGVLLAIQPTRPTPA